MATVVQDEINKKKPNVRRMRSALNFIVACLGPAGALTTIATQLLDMIKGHG